MSVVFAVGVVAVGPMTDLLAFDAPASAYPGSLWDGYLCETFTPTQAGVKPPMVPGTIKFSEVYGPWKDVRCLVPAPAPGRLIYGCMRAAWGDGHGGIAMSDCIAQDGFAPQTPSTPPPGPVQGIKP